MNMQLSFSQRLLALKKRFTLFHTYDASRAAVEEAIRENKSMDLDIAVDAAGNPFLGHTLEYYEISGEKQPENMSFWDAVELLEKSSIPVIVDCKGNDALALLPDLLSRFGPHRCLVHAYVSELQFNFDLYDHDYPSEWVDIQKLKELKVLFPNVTTTVSAKYLPADFLTNPDYRGVWEEIRTLLTENGVDTVCLNVPNGDATISDQVLNFFLEGGIIPHVNVDAIDTSKLQALYVGESDSLVLASDAKEIGY